MKKLLLSLIIFASAHLATAQFHQFINSTFPVDTTNSDYNSQTGEFTKYDTNGQVNVEGVLKYGVMQDTCTYYYENGKVKYKGLFYYGKPIGTWSEFTKKGEEMYTMFKAKPDFSKKPDSIKTITKTTSEYKLKYPSNWRSNDGIKGADCFLTPWDAFVTFNDNIFVMKMPIQKKFKKLESFEKLLKQQFARQYPDSKIISETDVKISGINAKDIIVEMQNPQGIMVASWTRYFVTKRYAYQLTLSCEPSQFARRSADFKQILNDFQLN